MNLGILDICSHNKVIMRNTHVGRLQTSVSFLAL